MAETNSHRPWEYFGECANLDVVYNKRIKLFATFLNGIGVAVFAVGGLAPLIATFNGASNHSRLLLFTSSLCILGAFALHSLASAILTRMRT